MKAIVIDQYGGIEQLKERNIEKPSIKDNQVLVELHATSINPIDWKLREGYLKEMLPFQFPIILGWDAAGIISEVGQKVKNFKIGDRVFARPETTAQGTYAEYTAVDEHLLAHIPENISFLEAAAVPLAGLTAWQCLVDFADIQPGQKVLIHAGAGGVGTFGIQIAKHFGAHVATTASEKNKILLQSLGADVVIDYRNEKFEDVLSEFDLVVDTMGGTVQENSYKVLKKGGKLVSIVSPPDTKLAEQYSVNAGFLWLKPNGEQLQELAKLMEDEKIKPIIGHTFPLTEQGMKEAHSLSATHHAKGKIVIEIRADEA